MNVSRTVITLVLVLALVGAGSSAVAAGGSIGTQICVDQPSVTIHGTDSGVGVQCGGGCAFHCIGP